MAKWRWAASWKRAAKKQRHEADRYFVAWIRAVVQLGWRDRQARAWKAAAKRWRRRALLAKRWRRRVFLLERDNDSQRAIASQVPYLRERIKELERRTFDTNIYLDGEIRK